MIIRYEYLSNILKHVADYNKKILFIIRVDKEDNMCKFFVLEIGDKLKALETYNLGNYTQVTLDNKIFSETVDKYIENSRYGNLIFIAIQDHYKPEYIYTPYKVIKSE